MSEPQAQPNPPPEDPARPNPPPPASSDPVPEFFLKPLSEPTDDTPTVISRMAPRPASGIVASEVLFGGSLRGRMLAHFELIEPIGVGGMAAVLRARDTQLDRCVALKILPPEMAADAENVRRFHQEARAAAKLDHENVARVFFAGEDQKLHFIAFEFVEGENLRTILDRRGRLPVAEAVRYMLQIAAGIAHAASRGVVHRDIKPSNIIIAPNGRAKLVDMGLARSQQPHTDKALTQSGVTLGTFDYISPEQALEPRDADVRSDIYSLGCTFYHVLTGQPSVPEGTAAKKLHHHQHVAPTDPRQLNPDIPDEVAAILARMMAKDPKDRYQRPEHLVQHLILVAQKLGAATDVPEGMLFVDAPLPNPPRPRPLLLAVAAAAALVGLVYLLGQVPGIREQESGVRSQESGIKDKGPRDKDQGPAHPDTLTPKPGPNAADPKPTLVHYEAHPPSAKAILRELCTPYTKAQRIELVLTDDFYWPGDLSTDDAELTPSLHLKGREIVIRAAKDLTRRPAIYLSHDAKQRAGDAVFAPLILEGDRVMVEGVDIWIDAKKVADTRMAAVLLRGGKEYTVSRCNFIQTDFLAQPEPGNPAARVASIFVEGSHNEADRPTLLRLQECCFLGTPTMTAAADAGKAGMESIRLTGVDKGGQDAVTATGRTWIEASQCAFGPHANLVSLQGGRFEGGKLEQATIKLHNCSAFLNDEAVVFRLDQWPLCQLEVEHSLFSHPRSGAESEDGVVDGKSPVLIRQTGAGTVHYQGYDNRYHNLEAFWERPAERTLATLAEFHNELARDKNSTDDRSGVLALSPWAEAGHFKLLEHFDKDSLRQAFRLKTDRLALRQSGSLKRLIGVEQGSWGASYPDKLPELKPDSAVVRKEKVVDPKLTESGNGEYPTLEAALVDAKTGDVILIRADRLRVKRPVRLDDIDITIKPHPDHRPVLTLDETTDLEAALLRVREGKVKFEQLEFQLQPRKDGKAQTVVALLGDGTCVFEKCVVTLEEASGKNEALDVATVTDSGMRRASATKGPQIRFKDCFVRGQGNLVAVRPARPLLLDVENTLVVLAGSFLSFVPLEAQRENPPTPPPGPPYAQVKLTHVTTYLTGHLIHLWSGKDLKHLVPVKPVQAADCLFAAAGRETFVHLDGPETTEDRMRDVLTWEGQRNIYNNFSDMLDQKPITSQGDQMPMAPYKQSKWTEFTTEKAEFARMKLFTEPPEGPLTRVLPAQFKVKPRPEIDYQKQGADIDALPRPAGEGMD